MRTSHARLVVGLGNPGPEYERTRHNIGFVVVDRVRERIRAANWGRFEGSWLSAGRRGDTEVICLKPGTYMNRSGGPTALALERYELVAEEVLVVYDDLDLPTGQIRLRPRGSSGGHRGVADILEKTGNGFHRLRFGIDRAPAGVETKDYVLEPFTGIELEQVEPALDRAVAACLVWLDRGIDAAMNEFNRNLGFGESEQ